MANLNHFAISAALGSVLGPRVPVQHGQLGSEQLAADLASLVRRRQPYIDDLSPHDDLTRKYEKAVIRAYLSTRQGFSSDRVLADPVLNTAFIAACRDFGIDDAPFHLNLTLIGLRKHKKLQAKSKRSIVRDQWRYAVASEMAARVVYYRHGASVDTTLAHPTLVAEFDALARSITPDFSPFEYRWAALNTRKKGASAKVNESEIRNLHWSDRLKFNAANLPANKGIYALHEASTCLFVAGTEDIAQSIESQRRIAQPNLFDPHLWRPDPARLSWIFVSLPDSTSAYRFGLVRSLVRRWEPVFNIPRGKAA